MIDNLTISLLAGAFFGLAAGYLGSLMVLKKMALVGDALSHVALPGLALGIIFNFNPFVGAFVFLLAAALATGYLQNLTKLSFDTIIGIFFTFSLSIGILIMPEAELLESLFGDIAGINLLDAAIAVSFSIVAIILTKIFYKKIVLGTISEDLAASTGINTKRANITYLLLVSLLVAIGIKFIGALLVGALVIIPAAAAKIVSSSQKMYAVLSSLFGAASIILGILSSSYLNLPAGPLAIAAGIGIFVISVIVGSMPKSKD